MAIAFVQSVKQATPNGPASNQQHVDYGSNVVAGNLLVVSMAWVHATATASVADTLSNTWTAVTSIQRGSGSTVWLQMFWCITATGGANTVTVTYSSGATQPLQMTAQEYSGVNATPLDASNNANGTSTSPSVSLTTVASNVLICGAFVLDGAYSSTAAGFTNRQVWTSTIDGAFIDDLDGDAPGARAVGITQTPSALFGASAVSFKIASSATLGGVNGVTTANISACQGIAKASLLNYNGLTF